MSPALIRMTLFGIIIPIKDGTNSSTDNFPLKIDLLNLCSFFRNTLFQKGQCSFFKMF